MLDDGTGADAADLASKFDVLFNGVDNDDRAELSESEEEMNLPDES